MPTLNIFDDFAGFLEEFMQNDFWRVAASVLIVAAALLVNAFLGRIIAAIVKKRDGRRLGVLMNILERPLKLAVITAGLALVGQILRLPAGFAVLWSRTLSSLLLLALFLALYRAADHVKLFLSDLTDKTHSSLDNLAAGYIGKALKILVVVFGLLTILQQWVDNLSGLLAGISIGGVALALAAQETAANLFGSITVMLDHPFQLGDYIEIAGIAGTVESMGLRSTKVRTLDQSLIYVPNSLMSKEKITNWSKLGKRRLVFTVGLTYASTREQMAACVARIRAMLLARDDVRGEDLFVGFTNFGESSLDIEIRCFTVPSGLFDSFAVRESLNLAIMDIVQDLGLSIAFPTRSVYVETPLSVRADKGAAD